MIYREELSVVLNQETIIAFIDSSHSRILLRSYRIEKALESELLLLITRWTLRFDCSDLLGEFALGARDCDFSR